MTPKEATAHTGRSETWLRNHECSWCGQTLWRALRYGCGAMYEKCDPSKKDFSSAGRSPLHDVLRSDENAAQKP